MDVTELVAGDSLNFLVGGGAYPASAGWSLTYRLVPRTAGNQVREFAATAEGDDFRVALAGATTAAWTADDYTWTRWVDKSGERYTLAGGQLVVKPNPANLSAGYDGRSLARRTLDDLRAAFATWSASGGTTRRYKIGEREREFNSAADIIKLITYWEQQVHAEDVLAGRAEKIGRRIFSRI